MPSHTSHKLQPCDVAIFSPLKGFYREQVERMERGGVNIIGKQHFTYLYSPAREKALTKRNVLAGWRGSGLFPFNPNRVLANILKPPPVELTISTNNETTVELRYEALPTPATPRSGEALKLLLNIIEHVPNNEASSQRKERLQQKLSHAAQTFLANNALLRDQNRFLTKVNDESKTRRTTKSKILGTARVMTWEDLEEARVADEEKEAKKAAKATREATTGKKRGRPRKSATADTPEPKAKVARMSEKQVAEGEAGPSEQRAKVVQRSEAQVAEGEAGPSEPSLVRMSEVQPEAVKIVPKPWSAPVARMY